MRFNSYIFVFAFFPLVMLLWHGLCRSGWFLAAQIMLAGMSLLFYGYDHPEYLWVIGISVAVNWSVSALTQMADIRRGCRSRMGTALCVAGIFFNLGMLFYFKYYDFFVRNVNPVLGTGWEQKQIALPLGISFFTFQQISFLADRMKREAGHIPIPGYLNFVTFFPQLVAGPIVNHRDLVPQFQKIGAGKTDVLRDAGKLESGICLFIAGLAKKVLIADKLGVMVDLGYADVPGLDSVSAFFVMLAYTFQIYFDFSGYSDMAVGMGRMLGIELPRNFDSPYKSRSVREFWNRWHMTLNAFFTQYVYIPLGGGRRGLAKKLRNTIIVFLLSGIWHGAEWTFIVWGLLHGAAVCGENFFRERFPVRDHDVHGVSAQRDPGGNSFSGISLSRIREKVQWFFTFAFVNLAWVLFRSGSMQEALRFYRRLFSFSWNGKLWELAGGMKASWNYVISFFVEKGFGQAGLQVFYLLLFLLMLAVPAFLCRGRNAFDVLSEQKLSGARLWLLGFLFAVSVLSFSGVTTFLYFNF